MLSTFMALFGVVASSTLCTVPTGASSAPCGLSHNYLTNTTSYLAFPDNVENLPSFIDSYFSQETSDGPKRIIFGADDRTILPDNLYTSVPYRAVCLIFSSYDTDNDGTVDRTYVGTGALVGPHTVITAAHLLYDDDLKLWGTLSVCPAGHKNSSGTMIYPYGKFSVTHTDIGKNYITHESEDDWAVLRLNANVGFTTGFFGISSEIYHGYELKLYGYHGDLDCRLGYGIGNVSRIENGYFWHDCDAIAGSSGGPITRSTNNVIYGIHSGGPVCNNRYDVACKITSTIIYYVIQGMMH